MRDATTSVDHVPSTEERSAFQTLIAETISGIAGAVCRRYGPTDAYADARQVVAIQADRLYVECNGELPEAWPATLYRMARSAWREETESSRASGLAGVSGRNRRRRGLATAAAELRELYGVEPTAEQILDHYNASAADSRSDARKQGAVASRDDFQAMKVDQLPWEATTWEDRSMSEAAPAIDVETEAVEKVSVDVRISQIIDRLADYEDVPSPDKVLDFADIYLRLAADGADISRRALSKRFMVSEPTVCRWTHLVRRAAAEVFMAAVA